MADATESLNSPSLPSQGDQELELCLTIVRGLQGRWSRKPGRFPTMIAGRVLSDEVAAAIGAFGVSWQQRQHGLAAAQLCSSVLEALGQDVESFAAPRTLHFGCWLVRDQPLHFDLGAIRFLPRDHWLDDLERSGRIDAVIARRVRRAWSGSPPRKRPLNNSEIRERAILDTIGACPDVCTVTIENMAAAVGEEKALLSARLGLTVISLLWRRPSAAMEGFGLLIDGGGSRGWFMGIRPNKDLVSSYGRATRIPGTTWTTDKLEESWRDIDWFRLPAGKALSAFASGHLPHRRDAIDRAIFLAFWWMHEALEAKTALMATAKFGAVLDTLAGGRGKDHHIANMLSQRLGISKEGPVTQSGRTLKKIVAEVYGRARSTTLHGLNDQFGSDWTDIRDLAEKLARDALVATLGWAHDNAADRLHDYA